MKRTKPIAYSRRRDHKNGDASPRKEAAMSPTITETHVPTGMTLERRPQCFIGTDERPLLRDRDGHVLAEVEQWAPESMTGLTPQN